MTSITKVPAPTPQSPASPARAPMPSAPMAIAPTVSSTPAPAAPPAVVAHERTSTPRPGRQSKVEFNRALKSALTVDPNARVALDSTSNAATFLSGAFKVQMQPGVDRAPDAIATKFFRDHGGLFGVADPKAQLRLVGTKQDDLGFRHFKYQQFAGDLPVFGQQVVVHAQGDTIASVGGRLTPNIEVPAVTPAADRLSAAIASVRSTLPKTNADAAKFAPETLGVYTTGDGRPHVAYELDVDNVADGKWRYYVDANDGKVLDNWSLVETTLNHETYDARNGQIRPGKLVRAEGSAPVADEVVNKAHDNAEAVYSYYKENLGRDSLDDKGMKLVSTVHYGTRYNNAFWDGSQMTYGDGDGETFIPLGGALDVVGHEMAHGVTERTAGLRYFRQSGALNESLSDTMGNLIEKWNVRRRDPSSADRDPKWLVGEDIFTPKVEGDGLRSMSAPGTGYAGDKQPAHMKDYKDVSGDNGGVHLNSGIPNKAAYDIGQAIGQDKLAKIWYRTQSTYLTPTSQFQDAANLTTQAAADLFGKESPEVKAVQTGWTGVGLAPTATPKIGR